MGRDPLWVDVYVAELNGQSVQPESVSTNATGRANITLSARPVGLRGWYCNLDYKVTLNNASGVVAAHLMVQLMLLTFLVCLATL